jgi:hypothetical protein
MLGYPVSTVADIASDPQLAARGFFQSVAGAAERFCGSFAVIDGARPPLRHSPGEILERPCHGLHTSPERGGRPPERSDRRSGGV